MTFLTAGAMGRDGADFVFVRCDGLVVVGRGAGLVTGFFAGVIFAAGAEEDWDGAEDSCTLVQAPRANERMVNVVMTALPDMRGGLSCLA